MDTWTAICARRNVRVYQPRPIEPDHLERILEAGWRAPSASNRQRRDLIVCTDADQLQALSTVWQGAGHIAGSAATVAMVLPEPDTERFRVLDQYDVGQATMAMALAAVDLGIGSGHSSIGDQEAFRRILGVPETHFGAYMLGFGYPGDRPLTPVRRPDRRPFDEVVHRGSW
jgi:nitroreductase